MTGTKSDSKGETTKSKEKKNKSRSSGDREAATRKGDNKDDDPLESSGKSNTSGSSRHRSDRDWKNIKTRGRQGNGALSPGAVFEKVRNDNNDSDDDQPGAFEALPSAAPSRGENKKSSGNSTSRKKSSGKSNQSSKHKDRDAKYKERAVKRRKGKDKATVPGAVAETNDESPREGSKRGKQRTARVDMTSEIQYGAHLSSNPTEDRARRKENRHKSKAANDAVGDMVPKAYQIDEAQLANNEDERNVPAGSFASEFQATEETISNRRPKRHRCGIIVTILLLLIGGSLTAFFLTRPKTLQDDSAEDKDIVVSPSMSISPSSMASSSPTSPPTFLDLYDPPGAAFCTDVAQNRTTADPQAELEQVGFGLTVDVTLETIGDISPPQLFTVVKSIQEKLVPPLLGCTDTVGRRKLQMIRGVSHGQRELVFGTKNRYIIADAFVKGGEIPDQECTNTDFPETCHVIYVELTVFLKDPIQLLDIISLISEKVDEQLDEAGVNDSNLKNPLRLEYPFFNIQLAGIDPLTPTTAPSMAPTKAASLSPSSAPSASSKPTTMPVVGESPPPTAIPAVQIDEGPAPSSNPSPSPSLFPTLAPIAGPSPPPSEQPTKIPTTSPSANPSFAPFPGPSPPPTSRPSRAPSYIPSTDPSGIPTRSPSITPTIQTSGSPSSQPSSAPSSRPTPMPPSRPTIAPSSNPSLSPTNVPTERPTFACEGHGVRVYADWDNPLFQGVDDGMYFLFIRSDWETVFGSIPTLGSYMTVNIEQRRNDQVKWRGVVRIWNDSDPASAGRPDGFQAGRREPSSSKANGQWETGDIIVPRYVPLNIDWRSGWTSGNLASTGRYFKFYAEDWEAAFGFDPMPQNDDTPAITCRNGQQVYQGDIRTFQDETGRRTSGSVSGNFEPDDYLLPVGMACPTALPRPSITPVSIRPSGGFLVGVYFFFDNNAWEQAFGWPTWGTCPDSTCVTHLSSSSVRDDNDRDLAYFWVRQCRGGSDEVWSGVVATSVGSWMYPTETGGVGRRDPATDFTTGQFRLGDTIVPYSRSCSGA